jgi:hypothetical protein
MHFCEVLSTEHAFEKEIPKILLKWTFSSMEYYFWEVFKMKSILSACMSIDDLQNLRMPIV